MLGILSVFSVLLSVSVAMAADVLDEKRPAEHFCPITHAVMVDPVVASDGHSYERSAIQQYFERSERFISPFTREPLEPMLFPNRTLRGLIQDWRPEESSEDLRQAAREIADKRREREAEAMRKAEEERARQIAEVRQREDAMRQAAEVAAAREREEQRRQAEAYSAAQQAQAAREAEARRQAEAFYAAQQRAVAVVPAPVPGDGISIPDVARGHEDVYRRFMRGVLTYKPNKYNDVGRVDLPIVAFTNPLEGEFDLSGCSGRRCLSINSGYRKSIKPENSCKVEIWIAPRFLIEKDLKTTARHFKGIMAQWDGARCPIGIFWTWGGGSSLEAYDYLINRTLPEISSYNLYKREWSMPHGDPRPPKDFWHGEYDPHADRNFVFHL